jgi:hypothetical protein
MRGVKLDEPHPRMAGGFADVYRGSWKGLSVALKVLRTFGDSASAHGVGISADGGGGALLTFISETLS